MPSLLTSTKRTVPLVPYDPKDYGTTSTAPSTSAAALLAWQEKKAQPGYVPPHLWGKRGDPSKPAPKMSARDELYGHNHYDLSEAQAAPKAKDARPKRRKGLRISALDTPGYPELLLLFEQNLTTTKAKVSSKSTTINLAHRPAVTFSTNASPEPPAEIKRMRKNIPSPPPETAAARLFMEEQKRIDARRAHGDLSSFKFPLPPMNSVRPPPYVHQQATFSNSGNESESPIHLPGFIVPATHALKWNEEDANYKSDYPPTKTVNSPAVFHTYGSLTKNKDPMAISTILNTVAAPDGDGFSNVGPGVGHLKLHSHAILCPIVKKKKSPAVVKEAISAAQEGKKEATLVAGQGKKNAAGVKKERVVEDGWVEVDGDEEWDMC